MKLPRLILASGSPRRRRLLEGLDLAFEVRPVEIDESAHAGESPRQYVLRLAEEKAKARVGRDELILAADTAVLLDGQLLGKPVDQVDAERMLGLLGGREHTVLTAVVLYEADGRRESSRIDSTRVRLANLTEEEIAWYVGTGEPMDKAGAYAVQGLGALLVEAVFGNYTNVVGLPLPSTYRLFEDLGYDLRRFRRQISPRT